MDIRDLLPIPDLENCASLLCIQPHPDDNEIGAGATIAKLAKNGCKITYLTVTDGSIGSSDPNAKPEDIARIRKQEVEKAAECLGVSELVFLNFPDGSYPSEKELCKSIVEVVRRVAPEFIMVPDPFLPYECHPDHRHVGMAAAEAMIFSPFAGFKTGGNAEPWGVTGIAFHSTAYPNTFIAVDDTWDDKFKALSCHASQFEPDTLELLSMYFGLKAAGNAEGKGCEMAEAFKVLSGDHLHMNVDTINM